MKVFLRGGIIFAWTLLITIVLYFPSWKEKVRPLPAKSLNVFTWGDLLDFDIVSEFEKTTGIKINLSFFASNEELQVKMRATTGIGYDLILPSDYAVALLAKEDLLKEIDHSKLNFYNDLSPILLNHSFDPGNRFSIPFAWDIYGFGISKVFFENRPAPNTWKAIFDPQFIDYKIAMKNDPIEVFQFVANYIYGPIDSVTNEQFQQIRMLLLEQRKWIVSYSDSRSDYYIATGNCPLAISSSAYIKRIGKLFPNIAFVIPKDGAFVTIENFSISRASEKEEYVYDFLNYLYSKKSIKAHYESYNFFPVLQSVVNEINLSPSERKLYELSTFKTFQFFKNIAPQKDVRDLWVEVKSF